MKFECVKYKRFERDSLGAFEAHMMADGWHDTRFIPSCHISTDEVGEFARLVDYVFRETSDWMKLQKFAEKNGTEIRSDNYDTIQAINILGERLDYTIHINGTVMMIYPYRKYQH